MPCCGVGLRRGVGWGGGGGAALGRCPAPAGPAAAEVTAPGQHRSAVSFCAPAQRCTGMPGGPPAPCPPLPGEQVFDQVVVQPRDAREASDVFYRQVRPCSRVGCRAGVWGLFPPRTRGHGSLQPRSCVPLGCGPMVQVPDWFVHQIQPACRARPHPIPNCAHPWLPAGNAATIAWVAPTPTPNPTTQTSTTGHGRRPADVRE